MELVSIKQIPGDEKQQKRPKVQLDFAGIVRIGQGVQIKIISTKSSQVYLNET